MTRPESIKLYREALVGNKLKSVLDLGCAEGYVTKMLDGSSVNKIFGVDISDKLIKVAQEQNTNPKIKYYVGDALELTKYFTHKVDAVLTIFMMQYFNKTQLRQLMKEINKSLNRGGY